MDKHSPLNTDIVVSLPRRLLSYLICLLIAGQPLLPAASAVITPSGNTQMDKAANGVPVVNIAPPNGAGVSHNQYGEYNTGPEGLILNNASGKLNATQLGGLIQNNPNLVAGREARAIINEVTGSGRSELRGYTEVAGKAANVMVANPYGITCDGCGFINTPQATLTTGKPVMNADGSLQALEVTKGSITINGAGLDASQSDAVSLIARATQINAAIHARDLSVTAGANRINADGSRTATAGDGPVPVVAIDTGALGGMYANRIRLVSGESGVGVNLGNLNARQGDITVDAHGKLSINNSLASGSTTLGGSAVTLSGDHKAGGELRVSAQDGLTLDNTRLVTDSHLHLSAGGRLTQNGGALTSAQDATLTAGQLVQDTAAQTGIGRDLVVTAAGDASMAGKNVAGRSLTLTSGSLSNSGTLAGGADTTVNTGSLNNIGTVQGHSLQVSATDLSSSGRLKSGSRLDVRARSATLSGDTEAAGPTTVTASARLDNRGRLVSDNALTLSAAQIHNTGTLSGATGLTATAQMLTSDAGSLTHSNSNLTLNAQDATLGGETRAGDTVLIRGNSLATTDTAQTQGNRISVEVQNAQLTGTQAARDSLTIRTSDSLIHSGKSSAATLSTDSRTLTNSGILTASGLAVHSPTVINSGLLHGEQTLSLVSGLLDNRGGGVIYSPAELFLSLSGLNNAGIVTSDAALSLSGLNLTNSGELSGASLSLDFGALTNTTGGLLLAQGVNHITAQALSNAGTLAGNRVQLAADNLTSTGLLQGDIALLLTAGTLDLQAGSRTLSGGTLTLSGPLFTSAGQIQGQDIRASTRDWQHSGSLLATGSLSVSSTGTLSNTGGLMSQGDTLLNTANTVNRGSLLSAGDFTMTGTTLLNSGTVQGNSVMVRQDSITNSGTLTGIAALRLAARDEMVAPLLTLVNEAAGALRTAGELSVTAGSISNAGHWQGEQVSINAQTLTNSGAVQAQDVLDTHIAGDLSSTSGSKITSNGELALSALTLSNSGQWIAKTLTLDGDSFTNSGEVSGVNRLAITLRQQLENLVGGKLLSAGDLTFIAGSVTSAGQLQGRTTSVTTGQLTNSGRLQGESLVLNVSGGLSNTTGGEMLSQNALSASAATLNNQGTLQGGGESTVNITTRIQNDGKILAGGRLTLTSPELANTGLVQAVTLLLNVVNAANSGQVMATAGANLYGTTLTNSGTLQGTDLRVNYRTLTNNATLLGTAGLAVTGDTLSNSDSGKLFSAGNLLLDARDFSGQGQVVALGDATLTLINALTSNGTLAADNTLSVTSQNAITNNSVMQGKSIMLSAGGEFINNDQLTTGNGSSTFSAGYILLNATGSLQAGGDVSLSSRSDITVNGFAGTAGSLSVSAAGTLLNTALMYAGNNVSLFADKIHNLYGDILAGDSLVMQKNASGTANTEIINTSGSIETLRGDIAIRTGHLLNTRDGLTVNRWMETSTLAANVGDATLEILVRSLPQTAYFLSQSMSKGYRNCTCQTIYDIYSTSWVPTTEALEQRFAGSVEHLDATASGGAGRIASGRDLLVNADMMDNQASQVLASRNMSLVGGQLNNGSWQSGSSGTYYIYQYTRNTGTASSETGYPSPDANSTFIYTLTGMTTETVEGDALRAVIQAGGSIDVNFTRDISNTTTTANAGGFSNTLAAPALATLTPQGTGSGLRAETLVGNDPTAVSGPGATGNIADSLKAILSGITLAGQSGTRGDATAYPLPSGNNGYFVPSVDPDSPYLITLNPKLDGLGQINPVLFGDLYALLGKHPGEMPRETDSQYTDRSQFLGSAYFLDRLGLHPEKDYRFLGDAAFDTRYVSNAILNQTGSRYISGTGSDLEQMKYLMDSAARQQKGLGLQFGVALSADQVSRLTGSLLWWESAAINGKTVMVPKLYLSPQDITLNNGGVISGNHVQLAAGNIINDGSTLGARESLSLDAGNSISNLNAGLMQAGGSLNLSTIGDISNISSSISGKTVRLESLDGSISNITRTRQWVAGGDSDRSNVFLSGTDTGPAAAITATDSLSMDAADNISITGANVSAGGSLAMNAGNNITVAANQINESRRQSGFWGKQDTASSSTSNQGSSITAGGNAVMLAGNDLNVTASAINAGKTAQLVAGNDLNLNASANSQNNRAGGSETHQRGADRTTVSAGDNIALVAGRDVTSQAAGIAAQGNIGIQAGRDVNLLAEETVTGSSSHSKKKTVIDESVRQQGTEIASGGNTTIIAGRDLNSEAAQVTASGDIGMAAGRDVNLTTATESDYHYQEETKTKKGFLSKKTTHTIEEDSATREAGSLLSGDNVTLQAGNNLLVKGSSVVGDNTVALSAGNNVDIVAATNTDTSWRFKETKKSGLMGTGGIGITIGSSKSTHDLREAGTTQSQSFSTIGSTGGDVVIAAGNQVHIGGADLIAGKDMSLSGSSVIIDPGHDKRTRDETFEQKKSGLTVALSGTVGSAINNAVTAAQDTKEESDGRLKALQATKTVLSGVQAGQAAEAANLTADPNAMGVSLSLTTQKSKSQQHAESDAVAGSTLNAGNNLSIIANEKGKGPNSGDIVIAGSQLKAGGDTLLDAKHDVILSGAANTQQSSGKNSSSGGGVGVSIGVGKGAGISVFANVNASKGKDKGNGTDWTETTLDSGKTVTIKSGNDTVLDGAQVNGNKIIADVGHDLLMSSQQDTNKYDSRQTSVAAGGSFTFGSMTGSGYISASQDKMKSRFDSVAEQTGMFAGDGGFDITVGNHTQLDGAVIASTATADKNSLDTGTLGFSDIHNEADFKTEHAGGAFNTGGNIAGQFASNAANALVAGGGNKGHAEGTTQAAVADGTITIRDRDNQKQNVADLSRDTEHANDSISPIFDKEKEQKRLQEIQLIGEVGSQAADVARTQGDLAGRKAAKDPASLEKARQQLAAEGKSATDAAVAERAYNNASSFYGTGGVVQRGLQAVTGALTALAGGGDLAGALAAASAPELANIIGHRSGLSDDEALIAHAVLGGVVASLQGNSAAAGAAGALTGELAARTIKEQLFPGKSNSELSESDKQLISNLATLASGLAGNLAGGNSADTTAGAQAGKNAVENNGLSFGNGFESNAAAAISWNKYAVDNNLSPEETQAGLDKIAKGDMPDSTNITKVIVDGYKDGVLIAGAAYLGPAASVGKVVGGAVISEIANGTYQWYDLSKPGNENKSWDYWGSTSAAVTGALAPGRSIWQNAGISAGGTLFNDGPDKGALAGSGAGWAFGTAVGVIAPPVFSPVLGSGSVPAGDIIGAVGGEFISNAVKDEINGTKK